MLTKISVRRKSIKDLNGLKNTLNYMYGSILAVQLKMQIWKLHTFHDVTLKGSQTIKNFLANLYKKNNCIHRKIY